MIGHVLSTNSAQQQVLNNRNGNSETSNDSIINDYNQINNDNTNQQDIDNQIRMMQKVINAIQQEINNLKNK